MALWYGFPMKRKYQGCQYFYILENHEGWIRIKYYRNFVLQRNSTAVGMNVYGLDAICNFRNNYIFRDFKKIYF